MSRIVSLVFRLFPLGDKCTLILDRTNWKWGKTPINILMLSIAYKGMKGLDGSAAAINTPLCKIFELS
jgi:hypothetical protein